MAPNPKVKAAFTAMKDLGISEEKVKPVLKKLLKLYEKNWELIEAENYRALLDGIFDAEDATATEEKRKGSIDEEEEEAPQLQRPLKRLRRHQDNQATPSASDSAPPLLEPKLEEGGEPQPLQVQKPERNRGKKALVISGGLDQSQPGSDEIQGSDSSQLRGRDKGKGHSSSKTVTYKKRSRSREIRIGSGTDSPNQHLSLSLIIPKDEPFTDDVPAPLAVIPPDSSNKRSVEKDRASGSNDTNASVPLPENGESRDASIRASSTEKHDSDHGNSAFSLEVASSPLGDVNLILNCKNQGPGFHRPSLDAVLKLMDEKCLQSYKTLYPNFSITMVTKLMTDICQCFLELGTVHTSRENPVEAVPGSSDLNNGGNEETLVYPAPDHCHDGTQDGGKETDDGLSENAGATEAVPSGNAVVDHSNEADGVDTLIDPTQSMENNRCNEIFNEMESEFSVVLPVVEVDKEDTFMLACEEVTVDVTDGEELVSIGWINELNQQTLPPFQYIPQNLIFCKAAVTFSLSQISEENCCSTCSGDCVSNSTPCGCARANGGKYAYTVKGLLSEEFLDECISMAQEPQKFGHFFCKQCPLQVSRNEALEPCKGHEKRNFIKECWRKCRCSRRCNNRVVQRGITCSLQVFMTSEGKGWGVRTLQDLPKGTFVCEYVGEILTHKEVVERNVGSGHHGSYQVFLDSAWDSISPEDNEALCLDSTCYGNIARFINHRCFDANLICIPVEVETPKHHYFHLAFFTTRNVQALEELAWDYGVDFDDDNLSVRSFKCLCGSQFCRNLKRSNCKCLLLIPQEIELIPIVITVFVFPHQK